jgi:hypothetical protein
VVLFAVCLGLAATPAAAQRPQPVATPAPSAPEFLPRFDFHLTVYKFLHEDDARQRFTWDAHFGGDFDLVDYVVGRASVLVDYEAVLGSEYRPFDPNQANYTLEPSLSVRAGATEVAAVFHHVSRHLSDRPKQRAVAWNAIGARVLRSATIARVVVDADLDVVRTVQSSFADYTWISSFDLRVRRDVGPRAGVFVHGSAQLFAVDGSVPNRGGQNAGMVEAGLRFTGAGGVFEVFAGFERRVDAYPLDRIPLQWGLAGFRLLSR